MKRMWNKKQTREQMMIWGQLFARTVKQPVACNRTGRGMASPLCTRLRASFRQHAGQLLSDFHHLVKMLKREVKVWLHVQARKVRPRTQFRRRLPHLNQQVLKPPELSLSLGTLNLRQTGWLAG
eukprot:364478-Chlamydomonas_euryale.AAC.8